MQSKRILIISTMLVMSITSLTNTQVFAQNTLQSNTTNPSQSSSSGLTSSGNYDVKSEVTLLDSATETPTLDATPTPTELPTLGIGKYDDRDSNLVYSGNWSQHGISNLFNGTESYSTSIGSSVSIKFQGGSVSLFYREHTFFGTVKVTIDGTDVATIDQYLPYEIRNVSWTSDELDPNVPHTITFTHASGTYMSMDAISVNDPKPVNLTSALTETPSGVPTLPNDVILDQISTDIPTDIPSTIVPTTVPPTEIPTAKPPTATATNLPPTVVPLSSVGPGNYDDRYASIIYKGSWIKQIINKNYLRTETYSNAVGSTATFTFVGENVTVVYRGYPSFGKMGVNIDGTNVATINQLSRTIAYQKKWTSGNLGSGAHTIKLTHLTGVYVTLDGLFVSNSNVDSLATSTIAPPTPAGYGTFDDGTNQIAYAGTWLVHPIIGNYLDTEHYSAKIGSTASFTFSGERITLVYRGYSQYMGTMNIDIDGKFVAAINQTTSSLTLQNQWSSGTLSSGTHTIKLTHMTGTYVVLDALIVSGPPTATPTKTNTAVPTSTAIPTNTSVPTNTSTPSNTPVPSLTPTQGTAGMFYVDSVAGDDTNSGTSINSPWKSLSAITSRKFNPGSIISFKRGSSFTGSITIDDSGTAASPIVFTAYGTGASPVFQNPGDYTRAITVNADYIIVERIFVQNTQDAGIYISTGADNVTVRYVEITNTGIGVTMRGINNKVLYSNIHDLHMVHNDVGGDDDYGAVGFLVVGSDGEIAYNTVTNCKAQSYDYGVDGGTVEFYGTISGYKIHNNYAANNQGFMEVGSGSSGSASNNVVDYNVMYNNGRPIGLHLSGGFGTVVDSLLFENNTVVDLRTELTSTAIIFSSAPTTNTLTMRNNIFYLTNYTRVANYSTFTHDHNLYFFNSKSTSLGFTAAAGESISNPAFVNLTDGNFDLSTGSPAINSGASLGYTSDYDNLPVPVGGAPDLGAHEYQ